MMFVPVLLAAIAGASPSDEAFVDGLLARMTFEEKVGQTVQLASGKDLVPVATDSSGERAPERLLDVLRRGGAGALSGQCGIAKFNLLQRTALESLWEEGGARESVPCPDPFGEDAPVFPV